VTLIYRYSIYGNKSPGIILKIKNRIFINFLLVFHKFVNKHAITRDRSVGRVMGSGLNYNGAITDRGKQFFLSHNLQTGSRAHTASYTKGTRVKAAVA
jgi:hypothetical protein